MPRQGQSVESCIIVEWRTKEGDTIAEGEPICDIETDKATFEVEAPASGTVLGIFYPVDSDVEVLKVIAAPEHLPALVKLLIDAQSSSDRSECQKTVAAVAHKIEDKSNQAKAVLAVLPSVRQTQGRCSLLGVLGKIGDNKALGVLAAAIKEENPDIQTAAIRSLAEWPTPEPLDGLLKVAESSKNKLHRILALRGFVRLLALESKRPAEKTIEMYKKAMSLAPDAGEKRRVLSGLANAKSRAALEMATAYLEDESLSREAEYAVVKIAEGIHADLPDLAKETLKKIIARTKNNTLREQAQEILEKMEQL